MTKKALIIKGELRNMSDLLRIARVEGKKILKVDKVRVDPVAHKHGKNVHIVVVSPQGSGCSKALGVESGKAKQ